jgi:organic hydroperoxide reductase OsmC/OhrA
VNDHGLEQAVIDDLIEKAHQVCPYSNATRNNVDVRLSAK